MLVSDSRSRPGDLDIQPVGPCYSSQRKQMRMETPSFQLLCARPLRLVLLSTHIQHACKVGPLLTFSSAPQPGTQPTPLTQSACSSSLFFRWHPNHRFEICQVASLQFSNPTHPCHALQNGQNLSNGGHRTSFAPSRRFHSRHPWAQTQFQLHQSYLCSAGSISKTTAHQSFVLALPSAENSLSHLPTPMMSFGPKYLHYWLAPFPQVTCHVSPQIHTQHLPLASCFFHGPVLLILPSFPEPPPATQPTHWTKAHAYLPPHWNLNSMRKGPSLLHRCTQ